MDMLSMDIVCQKYQATYLETANLTIYRKLSMQCFRLVDIKICLEQDFLVYTAPRFIFKQLVVMVITTAISNKIV